MAIVSVDDGTISNNQSQVTGTITNANTSTGVTVTTSAPVFTQNGGTLQVTATLLQTFTQNVYVNLSFTGTAIRQPELHDHQLRQFVESPADSHSRRLA